MNILNILLKKENEDAKCKKCKQCKQKKYRKYFYIIKNIKKNMSKNICKKTDIYEHKKKDEIIEHNIDKCNLY